MIPNSLIQTDARDVPISACEPQSLEDFETALYQFQSYFGDPTETLATTLENDPDFVLGHIFNASAMLMMSERQYLPAIRESIEKAESLATKSNVREKTLTAAARHWMEGRWDKAAATWDQVLATYPRDALAIQCAHLTDFYLGDATNLRDRIGRVIGHWDKDTPSYSYILGMQAFGLEECNEFARAEETGRAALALEPRDGWSVHAITHVMEMQNRYEEGTEFLTSRTDDWSVDNGFAFHNWWHLALFYLEQEDFSTALKLYDEYIVSPGSDISLELVDATALLWRLHLQDVDVTDRWVAVADLWAKKTSSESGYYAFNDFHAVTALVGAGRIDAAKNVLCAVANAATKNPPITQMMARDVGVPTCAAMIAFAEHRFADAVDSLYPIRGLANRFGGSNAQRDILTQTLIEAAIRDGQLGLASNLMSERSVHKPCSPLTRRFNKKIEQ